MDGRSKRERERKLTPTKGSDRETDTKRDRKKE